MLNCYDLLCAAAGTIAAAVYGVFYRRKRRAISRLFEGCAA
jgi:hypothetical protein